MSSTKEDAGAPSVEATAGGGAAFGPRDPDALVDRVLIPVLLYLVVGLVYWWINHGRVANLDYFVPLADAFLHGRLGLTDAPTWLNEVVPAGGLSYVVYPPAPAVLLLPAVALAGPDVDQATLSIVLGAVNVTLVSFVLRQLGVARFPRVVLSLVFAFGSITWYSAQAGSSWHLAHVVAMLFTLLAIWLCTRDGPAVLIGLAFAAAAMSRLPVAAAAPFFVAYFIDRAQRKAIGDRTPFGWLGEDRPLAWRTRLDIAAVVRHSWAAVAAVGAVVLVYMGYNAARFGSPFENGYALIPGLL